MRVHPHLALNCLSSYVRKRGGGGEKRTINQPRDGIVRELCLKSPDILGMSLYIWNIEKSLSILSDIHLLLPETILILGGPEASDGLLESLPETLQSCAILVRGEGEESLCQVLKALDLPSGCRDGGAEESAGYEVCGRNQLFL
ncbi:MAG: cobalamin-dependent protein [Clostridia bacterium]